MSTSIQSPVVHPDKFFIDGCWVSPSTDEKFAIVDSSTEEPYFAVAAAQAADMDRAVGAARRAFDDGRWRRLSHQRRATYLREMADELRKKAALLSDNWSRETGVVVNFAQYLGHASAPILDYYADTANTFAWEERREPTSGAMGLLVREPVGVVAAIVPWNLPLTLALYKVAPALISGCTVVLKPAPEAPGQLYMIAEAAEAIGLPPGVINVLTADREVSDQLVRDPRIDKVAFTGSTAVGRRIATVMGERIGRYTLELGGKSAAVILDDADLDAAAATLAAAECAMNGQVCSSLTRLIVSKRRHDEFVGLLVDHFGSKKVGSAFDTTTDIGPMAMARQRDSIEAAIARGVAEGSRLVAGGSRPAGLDRGYFIEPTVFASVDNSSAIARQEIFGPVLSVIPAEDEQDAVRIANDSIYGLNASVFTPDADRAREVAAELRSGTVGHNEQRSDFAIAFGGFKQSGVGREGGIEGLLPYLETKTVVLDDIPTAYR